ncbi:DNA glycosylase AlkZ-like family protein [Amycolatopsis saalfeldensis]|uniref:DNA glycosylase AlkZ-like family protein n=1 Tax=Amycolatopsis saalfeldensis TaxID=394193 RepID=UPI000B872F59|nr:crosslink repair DNA glycosylase YcaQ family protein [Amycolatopsis saalfeldensis]
MPVNGRLDQQRFGYLPWSPSPLAQGAPGPDAARTELAKRYFGWAASASLKHFRWFSGLTAAAAKKAVEPLGLLSVGETGLLLPPDLADAFEEFTVPREAAYALVAGIDGIHLLHRELGRLLDPPPDRRAVGVRPGRGRDRLAGLRPTGHGPQGSRRPHRNPCPRTARRRPDVHFGLAPAGSSPGQDTFGVARTP